MEPDDTAEPQVEGARSPRRRRMPLVVLAAAVVAAAVIAVVVVVVRDSPGKTVERYLEALQDGDVEAALAEADPEQMPGDAELEAFLTEEALRTDWSFDSVETQGEAESADRSVTVELTGFDTTEQAVFELDDTDDGWKIQNPFVKVVFERSSLDYLDVDGVRVADPDSQILTPRPEFPVFPGTHRFFESLPEDLEPAAPESLDRLLVPGTEDAPSSPIPELTAGGDIEEDARAQMTAIIDECATSQDATPKHSQEPDMPYCPFALQTAYETEEDDTYIGLDEVEWSVLEYPEFALSDPEGLTLEHEQGYGGIAASAERPGTIRAVTDGTIYDEDPAYGTKIEVVIECEFAPGGFRGVVDMDDTIAMYYFSTDPDAGPTVVSLDSQECTSTVEEI